MDAGADEGFDYQKGVAAYPTAAFRLQKTNRPSPTVLRTAVDDLWILPRAKNMPLAYFCTSLRTGAALSNPFSSSANNKTQTVGSGFIIGRG